MQKALPYHQWYNFHGDHFYGVKSILKSIFTEWNPF